LRNDTVEEIIKYLEGMAATLDGVTEENWLDTPADVARIYRGIAADLRKLRESMEGGAECM
jgi:hypothetical protein